MRLTRLNDLIEGGRIREGSWRLTPSHEVEYRSRGAEEEVILRGNLIATEETGLVVQVWERQTEERLITRMLTLRGRWEVDPQNRLTFLVERRSRQRDRLTLSGGWEVGDRNEILYRYEQIQLATKRRGTHTLTFRGYWELSDDRRLTYVLDRDSHSAFRFRGTFQTTSLLAKEGTVRYQVGVELKGRRRLNTVTLFGKWKLSRNLNLEFELEGAKGAARTITFGASYAVDSESNLSAQLMARDGKPLGMELLLTREFLKGQGESFLQFRRSLEETALEGGFRFRW